ncbi:hypothetical protein FXB40_05510 [Bradyrhizobium rifense]|uniref:Uncharacterized protein n=1 Tax=Bradyrhizobium rifense TaxID=515499 RepID=A0A5D3KQH7_9BRAD|nr:hypothetical protein [Bradyrhizobium rifense]TYL98702.1 hypothetical protein FXB40_05510 [Bradyrhizobium rifense]
MIASNTAPECVLRCSSSSNCFLVRSPALPEADRMESQRDDKARMKARHEMVMGLIDNNARQLRCDNQRHGVDIERKLAVRAAALPDAPSSSQAAIAECDRRLAVIDEEEHRLAAERDWLTATLAAYDAAADEPNAKEDFNG